MAEGGAPPEPKEPPPAEDIPPPYEGNELDDLNLLFARDLLTYVMRRLTPGWSFEMQYGASRPVTPFSFRIRECIGFYLNLEFMEMNRQFIKGFKTQPMNYDGFVRMIDLFGLTLLSYAQLPHRLLLTSIATISYYTALALRLGVVKAPYYALFRIQEVLRHCINKQGVDVDRFYGGLGAHAEKLVIERSTEALYKFKFQYPF